MDISVAARRSWLFATLILAAPVLLTACSATLAGNWSGTIAWTGDSGTLTFELSGSGTSYSGNWAIPSEGVSGSASATLDGSSVSIIGSYAGGESVTFTGTLSGSTISGTWTNTTTPPSGTFEVSR